MPVTITEYLRPKSLREALDLLADEPSKNVAVGGGVTVVLSGAPRHVRAVDLAGVGLDKISLKDDVLELGAMVTLQNVICSAHAQKVAHGLLPRALRTAASEPIRRLITVGGNIVQCFYWATLPPLLLALGGRVHLRRAGHQRTLSVDEFFAQPPLRLLAPGELVTSVEIPVRSNVSAGFQKHTKTANDYALIHAVAVIEHERKKVKAARLVLSACTSLPVRCREAEQVLVGKTLDLATAMEAARLAAHHVALRRDFRASSDYRRKAAAVLMQRAILEAAGVPPLAASALS